MQDQKDEPQQRIIAAAQAAMLEHGYADTSVDRIARRANASKHTIYQAFSTKELLFEAAVRSALMAAGSHSVPDVGGISPVDALVRLARWAQVSNLEPTNQGLYRVNIAAANAFPRLAADMHAFRRRAGSPVIAYFEQLDANGLIHSDNLHLVAARFGLLATAGIQDLIYEDPPTEAALDARCKAVAHLFLFGLKRKSPGQEQAMDRPVDPPAHISSPLVPSTTGGRLSADRLSHLLQVAAEIFLENGFRGTAIDTIAAQAGTSKMTIYRYFESKEMLFEHAVVAEAARLVCDRTPLPLRGVTADALIATAVRLDERHARANQIKLLRLVVAEAPRWRALARYVHETLRDDDIYEIAQFLVERRAMGEVHFADPTLVADQFRLLATRGNTRLSGTVGDQVSSEENARDVTTLVLDGLLTKGG